MHELLAFSLDLYRAPLKNLHFVAVTRPLPAGLDALLEALNKRADTEFWKVMGRQLAVSPDELRNAGLFLVKRLLFADGADYYRILGIAPDTPITRIRERYRLLMALFHPDRVHLQDEWTEQYAPRINEAYNTLKHPDRKEAYDKILKSSADPWGDEVPAPDFSNRIESEFVDPSRLEATELVQGIGTEYRRRPKRRWILLAAVGGLLAVAAGLGVLMRRDEGPSATASSLARTRPPSTPDHTAKPLFSTRSSGFATASDTADSVPLDTDAKDDPGGYRRKPALRMNVGAPSESVAPIDTDMQSGGEDTRTETDAKTVSDLPEPAPAEIPEGPVDRREAGTQKSPPLGNGHAKKGVTRVRTVPKPEDAGSINAIPESTRAKKTTRPAHTSELADRRSFIDQRDIDLLISRFIQAYEAGDTEKFISLFNYKVKTNDAVGRDAIARQYGKFFRATDNRGLTIKNLRWVPRGAKTAQITFLAAIEVRPDGSSAGNYYEGRVNLNVRMEEKRLTIMEFLHRVRKK